MRLSQTVLSAAEDCMLKAQYTVEQPTWAVRTAGSQRAVGTAYHAGLEMHYIARRDGIGLPTLDDIVARALEVWETSKTIDLYDDTPIEHFRWDDAVPDEDTAREYITEMVSLYFKEGHQWPDDWTVIDAEHHAYLDDPEVGCQTKFGADLVLEAPDGGLVIVDNKTSGKKWAEGKSDPRKNVQAPFYQRLARRLWPDRPYYRFVFDVMIYPNTKIGPRFERIVSDPQPVHEQAVAVRARTFRQLYQIRSATGLELPPNPGSTLCNPKFCDFFAGCPFGGQIEEGVFPA